MKFRAHDTFYIRKGWLSKGLRNVHASPDVFISRENNPMDVLGIGANMVKALRYWMVATGIAKEQSVGRRIQELTDLGERRAGIPVIGININQIPPLLNHVFEQDSLLVFDADGFLNTSRRLNTLGRAG